jgi:hypothetical protein
MPVIITKVGIRGSGMAETSGEQSLELVRPKMVMLSAIMGGLSLLILAFLTSDYWGDPYWHGRLIVLLVMTVVSFAGATLVGYRRAQKVRRRADWPKGSPPSWLGPLLVVLPGFVIVGAQAIGASGKGSSNVLGAVAAYGSAVIAGLALGIVVTPRRPGS